MYGSFQGDFVANGTDDGIVGTSNYQQMRVMNFVPARRDCFAFTIKEYILGSLAPEVTFDFTPVFVRHLVKQQTNFSADQLSSRRKYLRTKDRVSNSASMCYRMMTISDRGQLVNKASNLGGRNDPGGASWPT